MRELFQLLLQAREKRLIKMVSLFFRSFLEEQGYSSGVLAAHGWITMLFFFW